MKNDSIYIYNLFPLLYGDIANWQEPLEAARGMGFNAVFINSVFESGLSGSLYSIRDHFKIDKRFSGGKNNEEAEENLKKFIQSAHKNKIKVIIDMVLNHTSIDSPLIKEHPEWFEHDAHGIKHPGALEGAKWVTWGDLAQVDNKNSKDRKNLYDYWWKAMQYYIEMGFDGFRADAAYMVPPELWSFLIRKARKIDRNIIFIAETLGCKIDEVIETANCGFDFIFNSIKYWDYRDNWVFEQLYPQLIFLKNIPTVSFPESHDTERLFAETSGDEGRLKAKLLSTVFWSAGFMITSGFEYCFTKRPSVVKTNPFDKEETGRDITDYIRAVLSLKKRYAVLNEDSYIAPVRLRNSGDVLALLKISRDRKERAVFILNRNCGGYEKIYMKSLADTFQKKGAALDISPDFPMDKVPDEFEYHLRPSQAKILYLK